MYQHVNDLSARGCRHLHLVLGDQLDQNSAALDGFEPELDIVWMAEVEEESSRVWSHQARIALFLASMRHFRDELRSRGWRVCYSEIDAHPHKSLSEALTASLSEWCPSRIIMVRAGEWGIAQTLEQVAASAGVPLDLRPDRHFLLEPEQFSMWAEGRAELRNEHLYRMLRKRFGILLDGGQPIGGRWNFDEHNRQSFGKEGPRSMSPPQGFQPDALTREVLQTVTRRFGSHPGTLEGFDWPVTSAEAEKALSDFVTNRLQHFGPYQDAMWAGEPWLFHSRLSAALNLKLISPRRAVDAALAAFEERRADLPSVEGFIRQVIGWREFVRGVYWLKMPELSSMNFLSAHQPLPAFYWNGDVTMNCLREVIGQTLRHGYAHHIQRLMVTGLFALLLGVEPRQVHEWYLAIYIDAIEWVELPNTLGMSQYADGGVIASKPYVASGRYIARMSNYCRRCPYDPAVAVGAKACPFTSLYWDFLDRHRSRFSAHPRTALQWRHLERMDLVTLDAIRRQAERLRLQLATKR